jgi:hypothetical protein
LVRERAERMQDRPDRGGFDVNPLGRRLVRPHRAFRSSSSRLRLAAEGALICAIVLGSLVLGGCGGGVREPHAWRQEFTFQLREDIAATKRVGTAESSATSPYEIQQPYEIYGARMAVAKERLEGLEPAPYGCFTAEAHALRDVDRVSGTGEAFNQKNYTPALAKNAKRRPVETVERLERDLAEVHC